jgi:hypothetical protein
MLHQNCWKKYTYVVVVKFVDSRFAVVVKNQDGLYHFGDKQGKMINFSVKTKLLQFLSTGGTRDRALTFR